MIRTPKSKVRSPLVLIGDASWIPNCKFEGVEAIPILSRQSRDLNKFVRLAPFEKRDREQPSEGTVIHFFVADEKFRPLAFNPAPYIHRLSRFGAVATPDFSMYRDMPRHRRIASVWANRAVGSYFQSRGLEVIPTVRWSMESDYDFCFAGIPKGETVIVSNHGCWKSLDDKHHFIHGFEQMLSVLRPRRVILHGSQLSGSINRLRPACPIQFFEPEIRMAKQGKVRNGGR